MNTKIETLAYNIMELQDKKRQIEYELRNCKEDLLDHVLRDEPDIMQDIIRRASPATILNSAARLGIISLPTPKQPR